MINIFLLDQIIKNPKQIHFNLKQYLLKDKYLISHGNDTAGTTKP